MIRAVLFKPEHLDQIEVKPAQHGEMPNAVMTEAMTLFWNDIPVSILGAFFFVPGVIHVWSLNSVHLGRCALGARKSLLRSLEHFELRGDVRRIQSEVRVDYPTGQRWLESLGFHREGLMKSFAPDGTDCFLYGRTRCQP